MFQLVKWTPGPGVMGFCKAPKYKVFPNIFLSILIAKHGGK